MRVAIVNKFFFIKGGQETFALEQMRLLQEAGHDVAFFAMHHPKNPEGYYWAKYFVDYADFSMKETCYTPWQKLQMALRFIDNPKAAKQFGAFLDEFKPDVIHCHGIAHQLTYSILREARKRRIPVVQTLHDYQCVCPSYTLLKGDRSVCEAGCTPKNYLPCIQYRCVKQSLFASLLSAMEMFYNRVFYDYVKYVDLFIAPSEFLAAKVINLGLPENKVKHIPYFLLGISDITPTDKEGDYFLYLGRLSYEKGLFTLLQAFKKCPQLRLMIAGDGPLKAELMTYAQANNLDNVTFQGFVDRQEIPSLFSGAKAVILASEWYENLPVSIIEAQAYGKPVIGAKIGGIPEMVTDGISGLLFDSGNAQDLEDKLLSFEQDSVLQHTLSSDARSQALINYQADQHLKHLLQIYEMLIARLVGS